MSQHIDTLQARYKDMSLFVQHSPECKAFIYGNYLIYLTPPVLPFFIFLETQVWVLHTNTSLRYSQLHRRHGLDTSYNLPLKMGLTKKSLQCHFSNSTEQRRTADITLQSDKIIEKIF